MLEQQPARPVLQNVPSADPRHAQLAGLIRKRTQQIKLRRRLLSVMPVSHPRPSSDAMATFSAATMRVEFRFAPQACARFALERNHSSFLLEQQPVQFRLVVQQQMLSECRRFKAQIRRPMLAMISVGTRLNPFSTCEMNV